MRRVVLEKNIPKGKEGKGMDGSVNVDHERMGEAVERMECALREYRNLSQDAFRTERELLYGMNADFTERLIRVLETAKDWGIDGVAEAAGAYIGEAKMISGKIRETDKALSGKN